MGVSDDDAEPVVVSHENTKSKTFHFLASLAMLVLLPAVSVVYAFANRFTVATIICYFVTAYAAVEAIILRFPDPLGHENKTSRGTAWFLFFVYCGISAIGSLLTGTNIFQRFKSGIKFSESTSHRFLAILFKTLVVIVSLAGWIRICLAPVALLGFCYDDHTGQCIAHGIMGSSFIAYGLVMLLILVVPSLRSPATPRRYAQEFYDSWAIFVWGIVNSLTEHRWGHEWNHGDFQHTSMGLLWIGLGALGIFLTRKGKRSFMPALTLIFTGYSMIQHSQNSVISTKVHAMFGMVLMCAGLTRIIEISFVLKDERSDASGEILSFQYLPAFCMIESGLLFMGATEEQLVLVHQIGADHSSYILTITCAAGMVNFWFLALLEWYLRLQRSSDGSVLINESYATIAGEFELDEISDDEH
ncbi:hypothetical protein BABINDRAFT_40585 [Babjeviella inositovora NRRL Y-12698]|uniref:Protein YTP1-like C-terminal domain-containing protein n=1 Tax=Babjeviella inositovora NRRL Y-12698 TaxID=984486 RepID=A0A1E3QLE0_9ASCO|nr:uncharacterized protein BABINDRAFT_40585 [Babjeviella inositovora NRRL Y-12698]ODQ77902.1 hypothetical protein BABINDRAFT_40585 [Babjeviella inositovora NRRL Y-12698]